MFFDRNDAGRKLARALYARQGRADEYAGEVARLKGERTAFLGQFAGLKSEIIGAIT